MADIKTLTTKIVADVSGLKQIAAESKKTASEIERSGKGGVSTFGMMNKTLEQSATKLGILGGLVGGLTASFLGFAQGALRALASLPVQLFNLLVDSGREAETQILRLSTILQIPQDKAEEAFEAIRTFARDLPPTTDQVVDAFLALESVSLAGTEENLKRVISASLALKRPLEDITAVVRSIETEPLRNLGIQLSRNKDIADLTFRGIRLQVANTDKGIREGLLELFKVAFPDAIKNSEDIFDTALSGLRSLIQDIVVGPGSRLTAQLTEVVKETKKWVEANQDLIEQKLSQFVDDFAKAIPKAIETLKEFVQFLKELNEAGHQAAGVLDSISAKFQSFGETFGNTLEAINKSPALDTVFGTLESSLGALFGPTGILRKLQEISKQSGFAAFLSEDANTFRDFADSMKDVEKNAQGADNAVAAAAGTIDAFAGGSGPLPSLVEQAGRGADKAKSLTNEILNLQLGIEKIGKTPAQIIELEGAFKGVEAQSKALGDEWTRLSLIKIGEEVLQSLKDTIKGLRLEQAEIIATKDELIDLKVRLKEVELAQRGVASGTAEATGQLTAYRRELEKLDFVKEIDEKLRSGDLNLFDPFTKSFLRFQDQIQDFGDKAKETFDSLDDFIGNVASNIATTFSDLIYGTLTGQFDDLKDIFKNALRSMLRTFTDFIGAVLANPIRIALDATLGGSGGGGAVNLANIGSSITGFFSGIGESFRSLGSLVLGEFAGFAGFAGTLSAALPAIGTILAAAAIAIPLIIDAFKKTPRLDIDFDSVKEEIGRRAAFVSEFLNDDFFVNEIAQISVKRKAGLGVGGDEAIKNLIQDQIEATVESVQAILNKLPSELAARLTQELLNTQVDIESVIGGERLLEFDAKGKEIKKKFEAFINGELQAKFLFAIRDFFTGAFEALGVLPENAQAFIDAEFERFKTAGSREARAEIGKELLEAFDTFTNAFNIVSGNGVDSINAAVNSVQNLASTLGFDAVPSLEELRAELGQLIESAEIDPETVQSFIDLRAAIIQLRTAILDSISSIIGNIQSLNSTIASFGGSVVDLSGFLNQAVGDIQNILSQGGLSIDEQEFLLGELSGFANQLLAEERAAFESAQAAQQAANEAQRAGIQSRIDALGKEKEKINETFRVRIDALNAELQLAQDFQRLTESIKSTLDSIIFSPESVLTGVEQTNALQGRINTLQGQLSTTSDPQLQLQIGEELRDTFERLFSSAGDAFGVNSPEFVSIFNQVTGGLESLADLTATQGRSVEEISAEIERLTALNGERLDAIDAKIETAQDRLASIGQATANNTFRASQELQSLFEFIRSEYIRILEERFDQLSEISDSGFQNEIEAVSALIDVSKDQLSQIGEQTTVLRSIESLLGNLQGFQHGTGGVKDFGQGTLALLHGRESVLTERQLSSLAQFPISRRREDFLPGFMNRGSDSHLVHDLSVDVSGQINISGNMSDESLTKFADKLGKSISRNVKDEVTKEIETGGRLRVAVQNAGKKSLN